MTDMGTAGAGGLAAFALAAGVLTYVRFGRSASAGPGRRARILCSVLPALLVAAVVTLAGGDGDEPTAVRTAPRATRAPRSTAPTTTTTTTTTTLLSSTTAATSPSTAPAATTAVAPAAGTQPATTAAVTRPRPATAPPAAAPATSVPVPAAVPTGLPAAALQASLDRWLAGHGDVAGVVAGVAQIGVSDPWIGSADGPAAGVAVAPDDAYGVLSITKTFTEALVLRAVAGGRINLDAPMPALPGIRDAAVRTSITPRMLLQHSSGLVDYKSAQGYDPTKPITPQEIVSLGLHSPLMAPPGKAALYSNTNFHWLGLLLEHVNGRPYGELVAGLAAEVGLPHTRLDPTARPGWVGFASGGVRSTVGDLTRWAAALFTPGRVLAREQLALLTTVGSLGVSHGLWPVCPCQGNPRAAEASGLSQVVAHGGLVFYPREGIVAVVHLDRERAEAKTLTYEIAAAVKAAITGR